MRDPKHHLAKLDPVWERIQQEAEQSIKREALLGGFMHQIILQHPDIESALSNSLSCVDRAQPAVLVKISLVYPF